MKNRQVARLPEVAAHLIWHHSDASVAEPICENLRRQFSRDVSRPFSHSMDLPLFFYNTQDDDIVASLDLPDHRGNLDIVFIFLSSNFVCAKGGKEYLRRLRRCRRVVPIWIENHMGNTGVKNIDEINAIRLCDRTGPDFNAWAVLLIAHEIFRFCDGTKTKKRGKYYSIRLFLSHAKLDTACVNAVNRIRRFISDTNLQCFYDVTEISPGFHFSDEISKAVVESTLIAFRGDRYSSRYWCQKEILEAKSQMRPIVVVDMLEGFEDRSFPGLSNLPSIRLCPGEEIVDSQILNILCIAVEEAIRCKLCCRKMTSSCQKARRKPIISPRPPDLMGLYSSVLKRGSRVCYPEPAISFDENRTLVNVGIDAYTPLFDPRQDTDSIKGLRVGISASDPDFCGYSRFHLHESWLKKFSQNIARHVLIRGGIVVYGGDMRKGGVTEFLLTELLSMREGAGSSKMYSSIVNYLAWPLYVDSDENRMWRKTYSSVLESVAVEPDRSVLHLIGDCEHFLLPNTVENKFVWAQCLTKMRQKMLARSDVRICAGGRFLNYKGSMPGVLEEIVMGIKKRIPMFLLGGFGGVVNEVCNLIESDDAKGECISEEWQIAHNKGYYDLLILMKDNGVYVDYKDMVQMIRSVGVAKMANSVGLATDEYRDLMHSSDIDVCMGYIMKGLKKIKRRRHE